MHSLITSIIPHNWKTHPHSPPCHPTRNIERVVTNLTPPQKHSKLSLNLSKSPNIWHSTQNPFIVSHNLWSVSNFFSFFFDGNTRTPNCFSMSSISLSFKRFTTPKSWNTLHNPFLHSLNLWTLPNLLLLFSDGNAMTPNWFSISFSSFRSNVSILFLISISTITVGSLSSWWLADATMKSFCGITAALLVCTNVALKCVEALLGSMFVKALNRLLIWFILIKKSFMKMLICIKLWTLVSIRLANRNEMLAKNSKERKEHGTSNEWWGA